MVDEDWFRNHFPDAHIAPMPTLVKVQGIASESHTSSRYSVVKIMMPAMRKKEAILMELEMEVHLVKGLQCCMLIGVDMLTPSAMSLDFEKHTLNWTAEGTSAEIRVKADTPTQKRRVKIKERVIIPSFSYRSVPVTFRHFHHEREVNFLPLYHGSAYLAHAGAFL